MKRMDPRRWGTGQVWDAFEKALLRRIEFAIDSQRELVDYDGPDEGWEDAVRSKRWEPMDYVNLGYYSGMIASALKTADEVGLNLPADEVRIARLYVYGG